MDNELESTRLNRRRALQLLGIGAAGGLLTVLGCKSSSSDDLPPTTPTAAPTPAAGGAANCQNQQPLDDAAKQMRRTLQYTERSPKADKNCSNCSQFQAGQYGACGGCKLFAGAVNPKGFCLSHAPVGAAPPGAAPTPAAPGKPG